MTSSSPYFSIIIPVLNEKFYVPKLLESLNKQTFIDFEVLVVDGGSRDGTRELVTTYSTRYPKRLLVSKRAHVSEQRNFGAKNTIGKYLVFLDADVIVPPTFLQEVKLQMETNRLDFISTYITSDTSFFLDRLVELVANWSMSVLTMLGRAIMSGQVMIFKKSAFISIGGFDPKIIVGEDADIAQRAAKKGYKGRILNSISVIVSARRMRREGRLKTWSKHFLATIYTLFVGPIRKQIFTYPMGGKIKSV